MSSGTSVRDFYVRFGQYGHQAAKPLVLKGLNCYTTTVVKHKIEKNPF
jgi:hypothetical protein